MYLGIDISILYTTVYLYDPKKLEEAKLVYQAPSLSISPISNLNDYRFGDDCLNKDELRSNYKINSIFNETNLNVLIEYIKDLYYKITRKIHENFDLESIVINKYENSMYLKKAFEYIIKTEKKEFKNLNIIIIDTVKLLSIDNSNTLKQSKSESGYNTILYLDDCRYLTDIYYYEQKDSTCKSDSRISQINFQNFEARSFTDNIGLLGFAYKMLESYKEKYLWLDEILSSISQNREYTIEEFVANQKFYKIIYKLIASIKAYIHNFYKKNNYELNINVYLDSEEKNLTFEYSDFLYALNNTVYADKGLRGYVNLVKQSLGNIRSRLYYYGSMLKCDDTLPILYYILDNNGKDYSIYSKNNILTNVAQGAINSCLKTFEDVIPTLQFKNNFGQNVIILHDKNLGGEKSKLLFTNSHLGTSYFSLNKEYEMPLVSSIDITKVNKYNCILIINDNEIDILSKIYNTTTGYLIEKASRDRQVNKFITNVKIGLISKDEILIELFNDEINYYNEFLLKVEA